MSARLSKESILITESGNRIIVKYTEAQSNEVIDEIIRTIQTGESWSAADHFDTEVYFQNERMMLVNMKNIIGFAL